MSLERCYGTLCCVYVRIRGGDREERKVTMADREMMITVMRQKYNSNDRTHYFKRKENESHGEKTSSSNYLRRVYSAVTFSKKFKLVDFSPKSYKLRHRANSDIQWLG